MKPLALAFLSASLAVGGCAATAGTDRPGAEPAAADRNVPAARATGPAQNCIRLIEITNSEVRNDWTIDFEVGPGDRIYRNVLDHRCSGLNAARAFSYNTSLNQLCSTDIIYPLHQTGGLNRGPGCGLGEFVPMELVK